MALVTKQNRLDKFIEIVVIVLMATGTVFVFSAGANVRQELNLQRFYDFATLRRILFFPIAIAVMYAVSLFDYRRFSLAGSWRKSLASYMLAASIALLVLVLVCPFGAEVNYARRWLRIPIGPTSLSFQPSELAKWSVVFFLAGFADRFGDSMKLFWSRFVPACSVVIIVAALIIIEDFGTAAFVCLLAFLLLLAGGAKWRHFLTVLPVAGLGFYICLAGKVGRMQRIAAFLNPEKWADSAAYQANQSLIAISSGGVLGKGLGYGVCKYGHLPEDTTDFIFAIIGEELGFVGTAAVLGLFAAFVILGILVVVRSRDRFGQLLAGGIVTAIGAQAAINIGVVTVVLPTKGIPLPFISAGGTSMLLSAAAVGVLLNIAKQTGKERLGELP